MSAKPWLMLFGLTICIGAQAQAATVVVESNAGEGETGFSFSHVAKPSASDLAARAVFSVVRGEEDPNSGGLNRLHDGKLPNEADQPDRNFFLKAGTDSGRLLIDLGRVCAISGLNSYSWHPGTRSAQVYNLYAPTSAAAEGFAKQTFASEALPAGWQRVARVDSRTNSTSGGQVGVAVTFAENPLSARYLLLDISATETDDPFGHTFFSEIDVIGSGPAAPTNDTIVARSADEYKIEGTPYSFSIDASDSPELVKWTQEKVAPMAKKWYPQLVTMLASEGFEAPRRFTIRFDPEMRGVAATGGTRIRCASGWFAKNLEGEALGAIFHEMAHVVQQYGSRPRGGSAPPGWLVEGIPDYLRWYKFEPDPSGARIRPQNISRVHYNDKYRVTANFLNFVVTNFGGEAGQKPEKLITQVNAALRQGKYNDDLWKILTGHGLEELDNLWREDLTAKAAKS